MPSRGLVSLRRAVSLLLSHTHHFHSPSQVKTKPHRETDDSDLVFFDIRLDSVTLTEPGLSTLVVFDCIHVRSTYAQTFALKESLFLYFFNCSLGWFLCGCRVKAQAPFVPFMLLWFSKRLFSAFFSWILLLSSILPQRDATLSDGCLFRVGAGNWVRRFKDKKKKKKCLCYRKFSLRS